MTSGHVHCCSHELYKCINHLGWLHSRLIDAKFPTYLKVIHHVPFQLCVCFYLAFQCVTLCSLYNSQSGLLRKNAAHRWTGATQLMIMMIAISKYYYCYPGRCAVSVTWCNIHMIQCNLQLFTGKRRYSIILGMSDLKQNSWLKTHTHTHMQSFCYLFQALLLYFQIYDASVHMAQSKPVSFLVHSVYACSHSD